MTMSKYHNVDTRTSTQVAIIGLGYVGLPLAVEIARAGFAAMGIDLSRDKVQAINAGKNYIKDVDDRTLALLVKEGRLCASADFSVLKACDYISVCVPTPLGKGKAPDISYIVSAVTQIKKYLKPGQTIILESTTYPGTTEEVVLPILEESGLKGGRDFCLAFSPERIDPGNSHYTLKNTPKIIGGLTSACAETAKSLYETFIERVLLVSSPRAAEMVKLLENTFRAINIGLANEIAIMCDHLGIDTWEVIDAASTKPFGFMPFYPGPGLGGHCIPIDPHYLVWKLKMLDYNPRFIQVADEVNSSMPKLVVEKITSALNTHEKAVKNAKILLLGVAYKKDIDDYRESPALDIIRLLEMRGAKLFYHDPYIPELKVEGTHLSSTPLIALEQYDCGVFITNHSVFDVQNIVQHLPLIVDTRNMTKTVADQKKIFKI